MPEVYSLRIARGVHACVKQPLARMGILSTGREAVFTSVGYRGDRYSGSDRHQANLAERFLSGHGVRAMSRYHLEHPFQIKMGGETLTVKYVPSEGNGGLFGGIAIGVGQCGSPSTCCW